MLRHSQGGLLNSQGPDNPRTGRKKIALRTWAEQLHPEQSKKSFSRHGRNSSILNNQKKGVVSLLLLPRESHLDVACLKTFHLAFRPVVDCISCSVSPFPLHVTSFSLEQCSHYGNVHRRNLAASCFAMKSKCALQQRQCDASQSRG